MLLVSIRSIKIVKKLRLTECNTYRSKFRKATTSTLAQRKRAGPITLRSVDRNYEVLFFPFSINDLETHHHYYYYYYYYLV